MCSLRFEYGKNRLNIPGQKLLPINISESDKRNLEDKSNKDYSKFCERINKEGGYIDVQVSFDGKEIHSAKLVNCSIALYDDIQSFEG